MKLKTVIMLAFSIIMLASCAGSTSNSERINTEKESESTVIDAIMNRRSIRSYKPEQIKDEELDKILECGINAPSAMNKQSWEIRVIQNKETLGKIKNAYYSAPTLIVIAAQSSNMFSTVDCGLLGQNMLLAAESMDIGTCVIGSLKSFFESEEGGEVLQTLQLSEGYYPLYCIAMGYKNESPDAKPRDKGKIKIFR